MKSEQTVLEQAKDYDLPEWIDKLKAAYIEQLQKRRRKKHDKVSR